MENTDKENGFYEIQPDAGPAEPVMSFTDRVAGIFSAPGETFASLSKQRIRTSDWLIPLMLLTFFVIASSSALQTNPEIKSLIKEQARISMEKNIQEQIKKGKLTESQAEESRKIGNGQIDRIGTMMGLVFQGLGIMIIFPLIFFIITGYFYFISRFFLEAEFDFKSAMLVNSLAGYIQIAEMILVTLLGLLFVKLIGDSSLATLIDYKGKDFLKYILSRLNLFSVWYYFVIAVGLAKMASSSSTKKYLIAVFGSWLGWSLLWHLMITYVPIFRVYSGN